MKGFFCLMATATRNLGDIASRRSRTKLLFLISMIMFSLSEAIEWENEANLLAVCDNSTMHISVNFTNAFQGTVYQSRSYFIPKCSYTVPIDTNVTKVELSMSYTSCDIKIEELENRTLASTEIVIQMHNLLDSIYDKTVNVSCEIDNFVSSNETESEDYNPFSGQGLDSSFISFMNGQNLFGEVGEPTESTLFLVVNVIDDGSNQGMMVQNCIAHTDKNVTNATSLVQLSNFYGCPDPSVPLANFTVKRSEGDRNLIFAYVPVANFSVIAPSGRISITCGITLCENGCPSNCNDTESPVQLPLSDYATNDIVMRSDGAVMPDTLRELNRHNDRPRRTPNRPKRSLGSFFGRLFHWESQITTVSKENSTNVTSTRRMIASNAVFAKDVLFFKPTVNRTKAVSKLAHDDSCLDWETLRFIALMTICLFIVVVACYCCYADDSKKPKKGQSPFVF